jgi:hypothetical protein
MQGLGARPAWKLTFAGAPAGLGDLAHLIEGLDSDHALGMRRRRAGPVGVVPGAESGPGVAGATRVEERIVRR